MTRTSTRTPAPAIACDAVLVTAAVVRKIAAMTKVAIYVTMKNKKNCPAVYRSCARKYKMMLKTTACMNLTGMSATIPAIASVDGW
jgi:hypothetical protein